MTDGFLHTGHRERMRMRFAENGFENYSPHEVLEQVLFFVIPRANTNETAHELIRRFGSLGGVLNAPPEKLAEVPGIGQKAAEFLASVRTGFLREVEEEYRRTGQFGMYELAFLVSASLEEGCGDRILVIVFDEAENFSHTAGIETAFRENGSVDIRATAQRIADSVGNLPCMAVTADSELFDREHALVLFRTVQALGCPLRQLLYTADAGLYDLLK